MPCSVTRPGAAADPAAILDDAKASRSRSAVLIGSRRMTDSPGARAELDDLGDHPVAIERLVMPMSER
jgi:hypothetical protein